MKHTDADGDTYIIATGGHRFSDNPHKQWCAACGEWVGREDGDAEKYGLKDLRMCGDKRGYPYCGGGLPK